METAAEYVLALPELVSMILRWVYFADVQVWYSAIFAFVGRFEYSRRHIGRATLALAARVNKLWFYEAMRLQWADPSRMSPHSIQLLIGSLPSLEKRQFYAGFVKSGMVPECHSKDVKANGRFVKGVIFPKLRALRYRLAAETKRIFLADINAPEVDTLHIQFRGQEHKKLEGGDKVVHRLIKVVKVGFIRVCTGSVLTSTLLQYRSATRSCERSTSSTRVTAFIARR